MKLSITAYLLLIISFNSLGQDPDLRKQILSYQDSTSVLIKNSRKLIVESLERKDYVKASEVKQYMDTEIDLNKYSVFSIGEEILIDFLTLNYSNIFKITKNWEEIISQRSAPGVLILPEYDRMYPNLLKLSIRDSAWVRNNIDEISDDEEKSDFLQLVFNTFLRYEAESGVSPKEVEMQGNQYLEKYSISPYKPFIRNETSPKFTLGDFGWGMGLGIAFGQYNGGLGNYFDKTPDGILMLDGYYKRYFASMRIQGGGADVLQTFEYEGTWDEGIKIFDLYYSLMFGYSVVKTKKVRMIPFAEIGGLNFNIDEDDRTPDNEDQKLSSFVFGYGLMVDILPFNWQSSNPFLPLNYSWDAGLRLHAGMFTNSFENKVPDFDGSYPYVGISIIFDSFQMKRTMD